MNNPAIRPTWAIARDIVKAWPNVNYAAKPYLSAMLSINMPNSMYGADSAKEVVLYFLGNAKSFRGDAAKALKAELKALYGIK